MTTEYFTIDGLDGAVTGCTKCPRLVKFREEVLLESKRYAGETFWRKPVTGFGDRSARMLVVGLAPAASGANRTGRVFTGDKSSDILVAAFHSVGLSNLDNSLSIDDGLEYRDLYLTLAVRCVPPDNRPERKEIENCLPYLEAEMELLSGVKSIVALGTIAFNSIMSILKSQGQDTGKMKFSHGRYYEIGKYRVYCCYHPSPRNINTGRTSLEAIINVIREAHDYASA